MTSERTTVRFDCFLDSNISIDSPIRVVDFVPRLRLREVLIEIVIREQVSIRPVVQSSLGRHIREALSDTDQ